MKVKIVLKNGRTIIAILPITSLNKISKYMSKRKWIYTGKFLIDVSEIIYIEHVA